MKYPECLCDEKFRTGEDYRDHLPCDAVVKQVKMEETKQKAEAFDRIREDILKFVKEKHE